MDRLGDIAKKQGQLDKAKSYYQRSLNLRNRLLGNDPKNTQWQEGISVSHIKLGDVFFRPKP